MSKWFLLCTTMLISVIPVSCSNNDEPTPPAPSGETFSMKGIADKGWKNIGFIVTDTDDSVTWERVRGQMSSSVFNEWALAHRYIEDNNDGSFSVTTYMNTDIMDFKDGNWKFTNTSVSSPDNERAFTSMGTDVSLSEMRGDTLMTTQALPGYSASQKVSALYVPMTDAELQEIRAEYASAHVFNNKVEGWNPQTQTSSVRISEQTFNSDINGCGWQPVSVHRLDAGGVFNPIQFVYQIVGGSHFWFYFNDGVCIEKQYITGYPGVQGGKFQFTFDNSTGSLVNQQGKPFFHVMRIDNDNIFVIDMAHSLFGVYRKMTPQQLEKFLKE